MTIVNINDNKCWVCGEIKKITMHHGLPQHLKPKNNITIPICLDCHKKINNSDISGMYSYVYKIEQITEQSKNSIKRLKIMLEENYKRNKKNV